MHMHSVNSGPDGITTTTLTTHSHNPSQNSNAQPVAQPLSEEEKVERRFEKKLLAESLKDENKQITQKIMEIVIGKIPRSKGRHYNLEKLFNDVQSLVFPSHSEQGLSQHKSVIQQQADQKMVNLCAALGKKIGMAGTDFTFHLDELTKSVNDWDIMDTTSKTSKDKKLLQDVIDLIDEINDVCTQFVNWKSEINEYLETSRTSVPMPAAFHPILKDYQTKYLNVSSKKIIPFGEQKRKLIAQLDKRIKEDPNLILSEPVFKTIAATHEISVNVLKKNISDFHDRTKQCKVLKQKLEKASSQQAHDTARFNKYFNYLDYCVREGCYYGYAVIAFFEPGYFIGKHNYINQQPIASKKVTLPSGEGELTSPENSVEQGHPSPSSSSSSTSTTHSAVEGEVEVDIGELQKQQLQKRRQEAIKRRNSLSSAPNPSPRDNVSLQTSSDSEKKRKTGQPLLRVSPPHSDDD